MDRKSFLERICFEPNTGCWLWLGRLNPDGYGSLHAEDNEFGAYSAHRYSYQLFNGPLNSLQVLHKCDVRCCVNPDHLFLGTQPENIIDMDKKNRRNPAKGEKIGNSKIKSEQALEIKKLYSTGNYRQIDIAKKFGVERGVVSSIVQNKTWIHVDGINEIKRHSKRYVRFFNKK